MLLLDEATSCVSPSEDWVAQSAIKSLWEDKAVLAIVNKLSTVMAHDHVIVIERGRVVDEGRPGL